MKNSHNLINPFEPSELLPTRQLRWGRCSCKTENKQNSRFPLWVFTYNVFHNFHIFMPLNPLSIPLVEKFWELQKNFWAQDQKLWLRALLRANRPSIKLRRGDAKQIGNIKLRCTAPPLSHACFWREINANLAAAAEIKMLTFATMIERKEETINCLDFFYRTPVRSLFSLVTNQLAGVWRCQLKTCWGCYCCWC